MGPAWPVFHFPYIWGGGILRTFSEDKRNVLEIDLEMIAKKREMIAAITLNS